MMTNIKNNKDMNEKFIKEVRKYYKVITKEEMKVLINEGNIDAIVKSTLPLVINKAKQFSNRYKIDIDDLISVGNLALVNSYNKYDVTSEASFLTYVNVVITNAMIHYIKDNMDLIKTPRNKDLDALTQVDLDFNLMQYKEDEYKEDITQTELTKELLKILPMKKITLLYDKFGIGRDKLTNEELIELHGGKGKSRQNVQQKIQLILKKLQNNKEALKHLKKYI